MKDLSRFYQNRGFTQNMFGPFSGSAERREEMERFPVKAKLLLKSTQTSAAASKIKNKILNNSSFFKVSLKTNNKALALALQAQKEKSRQLEMQVVYLQKQLEALTFDLATKNYKHRKLVSRLLQSKQEKCSFTFIQRSRSCSGLIQVWFWSDPGLVLV
uniref:Uncharacterized protein n=1 Tax=Oryzias sinensis TaxID=183150 RepID=A0A8C7X2A1_9TELE